MKTIPPVRLFVARGLAALLAALALFSTASVAQAQSENITVSSADFQRLVYGAQLHTRLALKPELEAGLLVLLELHRRNPNAEPAALAAVSSNTLQRYRASAPSYIRTNGYRDEILVAYLDAFRQVPMPTNFSRVNLTLLSNFVLGPGDYNSNVPPAQLICSLVEAGNQRLFASEVEALKRQTLVDDCVARARGYPAFAAAMDALLRPETGVALGDSAAAIMGHPNSPLRDSPTMASLFALSQGSGDGSVIVSSNQLMDLFTGETQTMWDTIHTNLAALAQINQSQPDLLAYLADQAAMDANVRLMAAVQEGQPVKLACATAALLVQSRLRAVTSPEDTTRKYRLENAASGLAAVSGGIANLCLANPAGACGLVSGGLNFFKVYKGDQSTVERQVATQLSNVQTLMGDLSTNMNYRFDRVDQSLTTIFDTLNEEFRKVDLTLGHLNGNVDDIRSSLVNVQASLNRLESELFTGFNEAQRQGLIAEMNGALFYEIQNPYSGPMTWDTYNRSENTFLTYATSLAQNSLSSPTYSGSLPALAAQLAGRPLDANLNYIKIFLSERLAQPTLGIEPLANPRDWFEAACAYLQLAAENPMRFREKGQRYPALVNAGQNLANFLGSLTFNGASINTNLCTAVADYYVTNLMAFNSQLAAFEGTYASEHSFALGMWRQWDWAAPRGAASATKVLCAPELPPITVPRGAATRIAAGQSHNLALQADGTVVGWGANGSGQSTIPAGLTQCLALAAGSAHSLALKADGKVMAWGDNSLGQLNVPAGLAGVGAIAAGADHSLALKANGTVAGWGDNSRGQINIPIGLTNVVAIAAGAAHSLALKADRTLVAWGADGPAAAKSALSFDGLDDYGSVIDPGVLNAYPLTVSAWIKTSQVDSTSRGIINKYSAGSFNGYQLFLVSGNIRAWYFKNSTCYVWGGGDGMDGGFVADDRWHYVAFVVDAGGGRLFVDGILKASTPWKATTLWPGSPGAPTTTLPVCLGYYPQSQPSNGFYRGLLDEVRIWKVARSPAEVQQDMLHGLTGAEPGLLAYWTLDEGAGDTARNSAAATGSAGNGSLIGHPAWVTTWGQFGQATVPPGLSNVILCTI